MNSTTKTNQTATPTTQQWLQNLIGGSGAFATNFANRAWPQFQQQLSPSPMGTAPLTPQEQQIINSMAGGTFTTPDVTSAENLLTGLTSGPIGSSPDTQAAMRAFTTSAVPQILSGEAFSGPGRGGGITAALTSGQEQAFVPLVQQEIANRVAGAGEFANLATTREGLAGEALNAADMARQVQQQQFQSAFEDMLRRFGLEQNAVLGPVEMFGGNLFGQNATTTSTGNAVADAINSLLLGGGTGAGAVSIQDLINSLASSGTAGTGPTAGTTP